MNTNRDEMKATKTSAVGQETTPGATSDVAPEAGSRPGQTGEGGIPITSSDIKGKAVTRIRETVAGRWGVKANHAPTRSDERHTGGFQRREGGRSGATTL